ncbi:MAG: leucine-rich repeat protein, partial [Bacilli bacterium]
KENNKVTNKNKILKITALLGLFLLVFGISYALFKVTLEGTKKNRIKTAEFGLILTDKDGIKEEDLPEGSMGVNIDNAVPMSAQEAIDTLEPYEFNIKNTGSIPVDYELYIETSDTTTLNANDIKYSLTRTDTGEILSFNYYNYDLVDYTTESNAYEPWSMENPSDLIPFVNTTLLSNVQTIKEDKTMYKIDLGTIGPGQEQKYSLKMWIPYAAGDSAMGKTFEGNLKLYGYQPKKDSVYVVSQIDLGTTKLNDLNIGHLYVKRYSDDSIRIEGLGDITHSIMIDSDVVFLPYEAMLDTDNLLKDFNEILVNHNYEEVDDWKIIFSDWETEYPDAATDLNNNLNLLDYAKYDGISLYIGDGITNIGKGDDDTALSIFDNFVNKLYISSTVNYIGHYSFGITTLKEVEFVKAADKPIYQKSVEEGLSIVSNAFSGNTNLTKVHILDNLKSISDAPFAGCTNAEITIEALQSNVSLSSTAFQDVKSVTWLNG